MECRYCGKDWSENVINFHENRCPQNPDNMPDEPETDWEEEVKKYHTGGGYYEIPGVDEKIQGREKAIEFLKEADK